MNNWKIYHDKVKGSDARPLLEEAMKHCVPGRALDIGAGSLNESRYLAAHGFLVTALDPYIDATITEKNIEIVRTPVESYDFPVSTFTLAVSFFTLPFVSPGEISNIIKKIHVSLHDDGIFAGQFFGPNDAWKGRDAVTTHTRQEVEQMFTGYDFVKFEEVEGTNGTAMEGEKYWHIFHVIARKSHV